MPDRYPRVFVEWPNGAWLNSDGPGFQECLLSMVAEYGKPSLVEYRETYDGKPLCNDCLWSDSEELCPDCASG